MPMRDQHAFAEPSAASPIDRVPLGDEESWW
jgi:hypothetical protein